MIGLFVIAPLSVEMRVPFVLDFAVATPVVASVLAVVWKNRIACSEWRCSGPAESTLLARLITLELETRRSDSKEQFAGTAEERTQLTVRAPGLKAASAASGLLNAW
jgi:hypothetical protein